MLSCSIWLSAPNFWMGDDLLECRCVCSVYGAYGVVRLAVTVRALDSCLQSTLEIAAQSEHSDCYTGNNIVIKRHNTQS